MFFLQCAERGREMEPRKEAEYTKIKERVLEETEKKRKSRKKKRESGEKKKQITEHTHG